jgi:hypothetical protein
MWHLFGSLKLFVILLILSCIGQAVVGLASKDLAAWATPLNGVLALTFFLAIPSLGLANERLLEAVEALLTAEEVEKRLTALGQNVSLLRGTKFTVPMHSGTESVNWVLKNHQRQVALAERRLRGAYRIARSFNLPVRPRVEGYLEEQQTKAA